MCMFFYRTVEDIKLNSQVFHWPDNIKAVFELSQNRILTKREHIEDELRRRTQAYEDRLNDMMKDVESFKKKEVSLTLKGPPKRAMCIKGFFGLLRG